MGDWDLYFEEVGLGAMDGGRHPAEESFKTKQFEDHLVREMIQNSIDARLDNAQVRVEFELMSIPTDDVPAIGTLRDAARRAAERSVGKEGHDDLKRVVAITDDPNLSVLRVGDYGTTGLTGSEKLAHQMDSRLSTLTRGVGVSSDEGTRGGSYGIGSKVAFVGSRLRTVAYVSLPHDADEQVLAMTARLAQFVDDDKLIRSSTGFYIRTGVQDFEYRRTTDRHAPFKARTQAGTDTYLLGYLPEDTATSLKNIQRAVLWNFFVAVLEGDLVVSLSADGNTLEVNADTVRQLILDDPELAKELMPFVRAYEANDDMVVVDNLDLIGHCELRICFDRSLRNGTTMLMRRPRMLITTYKAQLPFQYAAIFICRDKAGNELLRKTEPVQHDKWAIAGVRGNAKAVNEVRRFIREALKSKAPATLQESTTVAGLSKLLPKPGQTSTDVLEGPVGDRSSNDGAVMPQEEGGLKRPATSDRESSPVSTSPRVSVKATSPATAGHGDDPGTSGRGNKPSSTTTRNTGGGARTPVGGDSGDSRRLHDVRMRSFVASSSSDTTLVLTSKTDQRGEIALRAQGLDGDLSKLAIRRAVQISGDGSLRELQTQSSSILDVELSANVPARLSITFEGNGRYLLTMKES